MAGKKALTSNPRGLQSSRLEGADLRNTDFSGLDLSGEKLNLAWLRGANFLEAIVDQTQFKFCTGISGSQKTELLRSGAIVRWRLTPWIWSAIIILLVAIFTGIFIYLNDIDYMNLASLQYHRQKAISLNQPPDVLKYDLELMERFTQRGEWHGYFIHAIEAASLLRASKKYADSQEILQHLLQNPSLDEHQNARAINETARLHIELKDPETALVLLENIRLDILKNDILFSIKMNLALAYLRMKQSIEALTIYQELLKSESVSPQNRQRLRNRIRSLQKRAKKLKR